MNDQEKGQNLEESNEDYDLLNLPTIPQDDGSDINSYHESENEDESTLQQNIKNDKEPGVYSNENNVLDLMSIYPCVPYSTTSNKEDDDSTLKYISQEEEKKTEISETEKNVTNMKIEEKENLIGIVQEENGNINDDSKVGETCDSMNDNIKCDNEKVFEDEFKWKCPNCNKDAIKEDVCPNCDKVGPRITNWICPKCQFFNEKLAPFCDICSTENDNIMPCSCCKKTLIEKMDKMCMECIVEPTVNTWTCWRGNKCSEINNFNKDYCNKCGIHKNKRYKTKQLINDITIDVWVCKNCKIINKLHSNICLNCRERKYWIFSYYCVNCQKYCSNNKCCDCKSKTELKWTCKKCGHHNCIDNNQCVQCFHKKLDIFMWFCNKCKQIRKSSPCLYCGNEAFYGWFCDCGDFVQSEVNNSTICDCKKSFQDIYKWYCKICDKDILDYTCDNCMSTGF